jgi:hypothetical protein
LKSHKPPHHRIEVFVDRIEQLFNSMDPSPFREKDLDRNADEFIVSWAQEFPLREPVSLIGHVNHPYEKRGNWLRLLCTIILLIARN